MSVDWTFDTYIKLLKQLQKTYNLIPFDSAKEANEPYVILRHDVDGSLEHALSMAEIEAEHGIIATYFVLFSHKLYNILEPDSYGSLLAVQDLGHEIGLHYDVAAYTRFKSTPLESLWREVHLLESLIGKKVRFISCHNPTVNGDPFLQVDGLTNAFDPSLFDFYVSDSVRILNSLDVSAMVSGRCIKIQFGTHPFLWGFKNCTREEVMENLFKETNMRNQQYKALWLQMWRLHPKLRVTE